MNNKFKNTNDAAQYVLGEMLNGKVFTKSELNKLIDDDANFDSTNIIRQVKNKSNVIITFEVKDKKPCWYIKIDDINEYNLQPQDQLNKKIKQDEIKSVHRDISMIKGVLFRREINFILNLILKTN